MRPFFSIGVTTYNRKEILKECLASILRQTFSEFEVIVGNDYPQESLSAELLGINDPRIQFINHAQNLGEIKNMKSLLDMGRGKYFTWLADDDMYTSSFLQSVHTSLVMNGFLHCVFTSYEAGVSFSDQGKPAITGDEQVFTGREFLQRYLVRELKLQGCYGVFDRDYLMYIGGIEQLGNGFSPYSDNLLAIKSGLLDRVAYIRAPLIFYRTHEQSISYTSTDADAYWSAQEDLCAKSIEVFRNERLVDDFHYNLFLLLKWCINDFYTVMLRSGSLRWSRLLSYLGFMRRYSKLLGDYRYRMAKITLRSTCKLVIQLTRNQLKSEFFRNLLGAAVTLRPGM